MNKILFYSVIIFFFVSCSNSETGGCIRSVIQKVLTPGPTIEVQLPKPEKTNVYNERLEVCIDSLDQYSFQGSRLTIEQIEAELVQELEGIEDPAISIRTHDQSTNAATMKVLEMSRKNGWKCALLMKKEN